jgi:hypothetical protein
VGLHEEKAGLIRGHLALRHCVSPPAPSSRLSYSSLFLTVVLRPREDPGCGGQAPCSGCDRFSEVTPEGHYGQRDELGFWMPQRFPWQPAVVKNRAMRDQAGTDAAGAQAAHRRRGSGQRGCAQPCPAGFPRHRVNGIVANQRSCAQYRLRLQGCVSPKDSCGVGGICHTSGLCPCSRVKNGVSVHLSCYNKSPQPRCRNPAHGSGGWKSTALGSLPFLKTVPSGQRVLACRKPGVTYGKPHLSHF